MRPSQKIGEENDVVVSLSPDSAPQEPKATSFNELFGATRGTRYEWARAGIADERRRAYEEQDIKLSDAVELERELHGEDELFPQLMNRLQQFREWGRTPREALSVMSAESQLEKLKTRFQDENALFTDYEYIADRPAVDMGRNLPSFASFWDETLPGLAESHGYGGQLYREEGWLVLKGDDEDQGMSLIELELDISDYDLSVGAERGYDYEPDMTFDGYKTALGDRIEKAEDWLEFQAEVKEALAVAREAYEQGERDEVSDEVAEANKREMEAEAIRVRDYEARREEQEEELAAALAFLADIEGDTEDDEDDVERFFIGQATGSDAPLVDGTVISKGGFIGGVSYDGGWDGESPRDWDNLGAMYCLEDANLQEGDLSFHEDQDCVRTYNKERLRCAVNEHVGLDGVATDFYISMYNDHLEGQIYATGDSIRAEYGELNYRTREMARERLADEVETLSKHVNGEKYTYSVIDADGNDIETCSGYYDQESAEDEMNWSLNASVIARAKELRDLKASNKRASHVVG